LSSSNVPIPESRSSSETEGLAALAADSRTAAIWTLVSRISGVGRVVAIGAVLGPTYFGNLFQTLNILPNIVHVMLVGQLITALLVPALVRHLDLRDQGGADRLANGFLGTIVLVASVVIGLCILADSLVLDLITSAVADSHIRVSQMRLGWPLLVMLLPQIILYAVAATAVAVQQAHRKFALPAAAPALENIGTIAVMGASAWLYGTGRDVNEVTASQLILIGMGSTAAVGLHAAAQWWGAYRLGIALVPRAGWRNSEVHQVIRLAIPSSGYAILNSITLLGLLVVAGAVPGGAVAFQIGFNFFSLPIALGAHPAAAALLPRLSRGFDQGNKAAMHSIYRDSLAIASFVALPASLLFVSLPVTLARAVSFGEMASLAGTSLVAAAIGGLGMGVLGEAAFTVSTSAAYACRNAISPFRATVLRALIAFVGMAFALIALQGVAIIWALGLSFSAASLIAAAYLYRRQVRLGSQQLPERHSRFLGDLAASTIAVVPGWLIAHLLDGVLAYQFAGILVGLAAIAASGLTYLFVQWCRGSREFTALFSIVSRPRAEGAAVRNPVEGTGK
jgi:putative peptidoglycan lipid II flippase